MMQPQDAIGLTPPSSWRNAPFWSLFRREKQTGFPEEELLSVYRDHGVVPTASRDDNHNKPSEDLSGYQLVTEGALVTNKMKAWQGSISISRYRGIVSPAYYVYRPLGEEHDQFLHYLLRSEPYIALYQRISKGVRVNQWDLEHEALRTIPVLLPDLPTQKRIADFLDRETSRIDQLIEKKMKLNEILKEKREDVISEQISSTVWPTTKLKHLAACPITNGVGEAAEFDDPEWPRYIRITDIETATTLKSNIFKSLPNDVASKAPVEFGDILFAAVGASFGKSYLHKSEGNFCYAGFLVRFRANTLVYPEYISLWAQSRDFRQQLDSGSVQATIQNFSAGKYRNLQVPHPPVQEQVKIIEEVKNAIDKIDMVIKKNMDAIDFLEERRSSLITAAVTGQLDVSSHQPLETV
ncbi:restriction endonuclease subunit S [Sulfitobacter sp. 1A13353]|uniref:restriction endonuclease subunit S n=1 Tax=Sulfitobacter sp. 1A13353 TaxID=3368568 RepID=UPI003745C3EF